MFRVIVMGGLSLVGPAACASTTGPTDGADVTPDLPSELPVFVDAGPGPDAADVPPDFPCELPVFIDASNDAADAPVDASADGDAAEAAADSGFPLECPAGDVACGGVCVNTATDSRNCGVCGHACGTSEECLSGICHAPPSDGGTGG
jgi:hypothetical protein